MLQVKIIPVTHSYSEYLSTNRIKLSAKTKIFCQKSKCFSHFPHIREFSYYKMDHKAAILFPIFMFYTSNCREFHSVMITKNIVLQIIVNSEDMGLKEPEFVDFTLE